MFRLIIVMILAGTGVAFAQPVDATCKTTETQAECFARLKCQPNEELADCQKRLRASSSNGNGNNGNGNNDNGGNDGGARSDNGDRGGDRSSGRRRGGDSDRGDSDRGDSDRGGGGERRSRRSSGGSSSRHFEANKTFGAGLELGEPTGLNGKYFLSSAGALDFGIGEIYDTYYFGNGIHLYADYLWHPISLASTDTFELPFYIGVGGRFWNFHYCYGPGPDPNRCDYGGSALGVRVPIGITFDFNNLPLDIFVQFVPVLDFVTGNYYDRYGDRLHFGVDFSFGARYWFK